MFLRRFRKRQKPQFSAVRFNGSPAQAAEIVQLDSCLIRKFRAGGMIIEVYQPNRPEPLILNCGDWLVKTRFGEWMVLSHTVFTEIFEETA